MVLDSRAMGGGEGESSKNFFQMSKLFSWKSATPRLTSQEKRNGVTSIRKISFDRGAITFKKPG